MKALNGVSCVSQFCGENWGNSRPGEMIENSRIFHRLCDRYQVSLAIPKSFNAKKKAPSISNADLPHCQISGMSCTGPCNKSGNFLSPVQSSVALPWNDQWRV